jgi:hypothetical protein
MITKPDKIIAFTVLNNSLVLVIKGVLDFHGYIVDSTNVISDIEVTVDGYNCKTYCTAEIDPVTSFGILLSEQEYKPGDTFDELKDDFEYFMGIPSSGGGGSGSPTNITSNDLLVGGSGYSRTINIKDQDVSSAISKVNGLFAVKIDGNTIVKDSSGILSAVSSGTGQPTDISSDNLDVGGVAYSRTVNIKEQSETSTITEDGGLFDVKVDGSSIVKNSDGSLQSVGGGGEGQPTAISSTSLNVGGVGYNRTVDVKTQSEASSISNTAGLFDVKIDGSTITRDTDGTLKSPVSDNFYDYVNQTQYSKNTFLRNVQTDSNKYGITPNNITTNNSFSADVLSGLIDELTTAKELNDTLDYCISSYFPGV